MPQMDGTGPWGYGPRTGRGRGPCRPGYGYGLGFGRYSAETPEARKARLEAQKRQIEEELANL